MLILGFTQYQDSVDLFYEGELICTVKYIKKDKNQTRIAFTAGKSIEIMRRRLTLESKGKVPKLIDIDQVIKKKITKVLSHSGNLIKKLKLE